MNPKSITYAEMRRAEQLLFRSMVYHAELVKGGLLINPKKGPIGAAADCIAHGRPVTWIRSL